MTGGEPSPNRNTFRQDLRGTGPELKTYVNERIAQSDGTDPELNDCSVAMALLLADRIGEHGVIPEGYLKAVMQLIVDAAEGVDSYTGEPIPDIITKYSPPTIALFSIQAAIFARESFGDAFADELDKLEVSLGAAQAKTSRTIE
jgi:hypothetical protein